MRSARRNKKVFLTLGAAGVALVSLLSACGSSSSSDAAGGSSDTPSVTKLTVGIDPANLQDTFQYVAQAEGFYTQNGLKVTLQDIASAATQSLALQSGTLDIASAEIDVFLTAPTAAQFRVVAGANASNPLLIADPKIQTANAKLPFPAPLKDLIGKSIGVPVLGTGPQLVLEKMLESAGVQPNQVKFVKVGNTSTSVPAMEAGQVQAIYGTASSALQVKAAGVPYYVVAKSSQVPNVNLSNAFFASMGVTTQAKIDKEPTAITNYCKAISESIAWMKDPANETKLVADTQKWMGLKTAASAKTQIEGALSSLVTKISEQDWNNSTAVFPNPHNLSYSQSVYANC